MVVDTIEIKMWDVKRCLYTEIYYDTIILHIIWSTKLIFFVEVGYNKKYLKVFEYLPNVSYLNIL